MKKWHVGLVVLFILTDVFLFFKILLSQGNIQIFNPQGMIAVEQKQLLIIYLCLMLLIIIPVVISGYFIAWKYRSGNTKAHYNPNGKHSLFSEILVWALPTSIVIVMSVVTWSATHKLDPTKQIVSTNKPLTVQVVSLRWKWL